MLNIQIRAKKKTIKKLIFIEILTGIMMYYLDFPFGTQTIHVMLATLLFGFQFYMVLESNSKKTIL